MSFRFARAPAIFGTTPNWYAARSFQQQRSLTDKYILVRRYSTDKVNEPETTNNNNNNQPTAEDQIKQLSMKLQQSEKQLQENEQKYKELQGSYLMTLADMENLRIRTKKEVENASHYSITKFARDLLSVADVLEMALSILPNQEKTVLKSSAAMSGSEGEIHKILEEFEAGVKLTYQELLHIFKRYDVIPFEDLLGKKFDPTFHTGLFEVPKKNTSMKKDGGIMGGVESKIESDAENKTDNNSDMEEPVIVHVQKKGYKIKDRVLRPAEVGLAK
jgi:molecular chaperone GrpE (heat shock protein)